MHTTFDWRRFKSACRGRQPPRGGMNLDEIGKIAAAYDVETSDRTRASILADLN